MGKKKVISEEELREMVLPGEGQVLGVVIQMLGFDRLMVRCEDGYSRICRIRGKMKRRVWIKVGDVVLVEPWDFQSESRGDIVWRYTESQAETLRRKRLLTVERILCGGVRWIGRRGRQPWRSGDT
ncbi:MAG: translation initiation factor eIF-1A [Candidatus Bathyarchaeia archaeon]